MLYIDEGLIYVVLKRRGGGVKVRVLSMWSESMSGSCM